MAEEKTIASKGRFMHEYEVLMHRPDADALVSGMFALNIVAEDLLEACNIAVNKHLDAEVYEAKWVAGIDYVQIDGIAAVRKLVASRVEDAVWRSALKLRDKVLDQLEGDEVPEPAIQAVEDVVAKFIDERKPDAKKDDA